MEARARAEEKGGESSRGVKNRGRWASEKGGRESYTPLEGRGECGGSLRSESRIEWLSRRRGGRTHRFQNALVSLEPRRRAPRPSGFPAPLRYRPEVPAFISISPSHLFLPSRLSFYTRASERDFSAVKKIIVPLQYGFYCLLFPDFSQALEHLLFFTLESLF